MKYSFSLPTTWLLLIGIAAATHHVVLLAGGPVGSGPLVTQPLVMTGFIEAWETAATSRLQKGPWQLKSGVWGSVTQQDFRGAGRKYAVAAGRYHG